MSRFTIMVLLIGIADIALADCFDRAATRHRIPADLLRAIACVESGHDAYAVNRNTDGSVDLGVMQINSWWLPTLRRFGIEGDHLWDFCTNVHVGAWVLAHNIKIFGLTWRAIGAYNAGPVESPEREKLRYAYEQKVYRAVDRGC